MADYLKGKQYARYGGKDYLDKIYSSNKPTPVNNNVFDKNGYLYRCYCSQTFRYYHELKLHRKEANHKEK